MYRRAFAFCTRSTTSCNLRVILMAKCNTGHRLAIVPGKALRVRCFDRSGLRALRDAVGCTNDSIVRPSSVMRQHARNALTGTRREHSYTHHFPARLDYSSSCRRRRSALIQRVCHPPGVACIFEWTPDNLCASSTPFITRRTLATTPLTICTHRRLHDALTVYEDYAAQVRLFRTLRSPR